MTNNQDIRERLALVGNKFERMAELHNKVRALYNLPPLHFEGLTQHTVQAQPEVPTTLEVSDDLIDNVINTTPVEDIRDEAKHTMSEYKDATADLHKMVDDIDIDVAVGELSNDDIMAAFGVSFDTNR